MRMQNRRVGFARMMGTAVVAGIAVCISTAAADPGDVAAGQEKYKAVKAGAKHLIAAKQALEGGKGGFMGHRLEAIKLIDGALDELDQAVKYADRKMEAGERIEPRFEPQRGKLASTQAKYKAIAAGAESVIAAGKALDLGFDKFGGHRVKAINLLNNALDELEKAAKAGE